MAEPAARGMTVPQFLEWVATRPSGRYELVNGEVWSMSAETADHARVKARAWRALSDAIARANLPCEAFVDSLGVAIDETLLYEPDALVTCGEPVPPDALVAASPIVIVEVVSRSSRRIDTNVKLADYFRLPSLHHYLVLDSVRRLALHYSRQGERIAVALVQDGALTLDPPGLSIQIADLFP